MAETEQQAAAGTATQTVDAGQSLLDQAIAATKQTEPSEAQALLKTLTDEAMKGTLKFNKNLIASLSQAIALIDGKISEQLAAVMHHEKFLKLEGSWRGLHYLVMNSETGQLLKLKVLNISKRELGRDLERAVEFDQSQLFKKIYENEFGTPGGEPYGAMIGDYEFNGDPGDIQMLDNLAKISAAAFAPLISAASPNLFGMESFTELSQPRDLAKIFESKEFIKWRSYRESEDSRFVTLTMPRVLARLPYGAKTLPVEEFDYEESQPKKQLPHDQYCWMNAAYVMGTKLTDAFAKYGFCTAIRGAEGGGKVENLPCHVFQSDDGDLDLQCPTEVGITDRREKELSDAGFLPLCHYKNTDYAVFFGAQSTQKPKKYDRPAATANAAISARLPYLMATSRFAHYLKIIARDKIGSFMERSDCEAWLNRWIQNYVNTNPNVGQELKARYPLQDAKVEVQEIPGKPGSYNAVAFLRPWLQLEELTASLRLVARIPQRS
ncbi:MAG: type VI secretion system contractile sheath large subunit [Rhodospirillales bacterium]